MYSIAQFGTFEVENYGDLLFPIIFEKEISQRLRSFKIQLYSPLGNDSIKPIIPNKNSSLFSNTPPHAIVIGGGDIISFSTNIASCYKKGWHSIISPHAACWALPSIQRPAGVPIIWNAPGAPFLFTQEQAEIVRVLANEVDYLSVRDSISLSYLQQAGVEKDIAIIPDTVCNLAQHFPKEEIKLIAKKLFEPLGLEIGEPLVFQMHLAVNEDQLPEIAQTLLQLKEILKRPILLLPIGYCHEDHYILEKLKMISPQNFLLLEEKLDPLNLIAVIAHAGCFIGTSLHGNITAFAYQIPHVIYNAAKLTKLKGFSELINEPQRCITHIQQLHSRYSLLQVPPQFSTLQQICAQIKKHFDCIASLMIKGSTAQQAHHDRELLTQYLYLTHQIEKLREDLQQTSQSDLRISFFQKLKQKFKLFPDYFANF